MSIARRPVFAARTATTTDLLHTRNGRSFSSAELSRQLGVAPFTAWSMRRKITRAVQRKEGELMLAGVVEMDEACVGGASKGKRGRGASGKTPVAVMCEQNESGGCDLVHIQVTHDISGLSLGDAATSYI
ncbi:MAG: transposase, partial [Actinobacteria bacterium]|nr:transposase [Actinomycetota bacterium]